MARNGGDGGGLALLALTVDSCTVADARVTWDRREEVQTVTAGRLVGCLHYTSVVARMAGDEYVVLAEGTGDIPSATGLADQILTSVRWPDPRRVDGSVTASIGIALQQSFTTAERLLTNADVAMYSARGGGGDRYQVFQEWMCETEVAGSPIS
jgi:GGDEF domain-containing protein